MKFKGHLAGMVAGLICLPFLCYGQDHLSALLQKAEQGDADARFELGLLHYSGAGVPRKIETADGFTLYMPSDWSSIPRGVIDAYADESAKMMAPNAKKEIYDYGFQLASAQDWFEYPYILIQVKRTGRFPESQLESIKQVSRLWNKSFTEIQDAMSSVASDAQCGELTYDPQTHILWIQTQMHMNDKGIGTVRGLSGTLLTDAGVICINGYAKDKDFPRYLPLFEAIIKNVTVSDNLRYKPRACGLSVKGAGVPQYSKEAIKWWRLAAEQSYADSSKGFYLRCLVIFIAGVVFLFVLIRWLLHQLRWLPGSSAWDNQMNVITKQRWSAQAISSFVAGLGGLLVFGLYGAVPAVIFGHIALSRIRKGMVLQSHILILTIKGRGLAIAGLVMGYLGIIVFFIMGFFHYWRTNPHPLAGAIFMIICLWLLGVGKTQRGKNN